MPPIRRPSFPTKSFRYNPFPRPSSQVAQPFGPRMADMHLEQLWRLQKSTLAIGCAASETCKLLKDHFSKYDRVGGIDVYMKRLIEMGVDLSTVYKKGDTLDKWTLSFHFVPGNGFASGMADAANRLTHGIEASDTDGCGGLGQLFFRAVQVAWENKPPTGWVVLVLAAKMGMMLWKGRRSRGLNAQAINQASEEDDDGDDSDGDGDGDQGGQIMCRVRLDKASDGQRTAKVTKALPRWVWGYFLSGGEGKGKGKEVQVTPNGKVRLRVCFPSSGKRGKRGKRGKSEKGGKSGKTGWFGADQVEFVNGEKFNGHDLRKR